MTGGPQASAPSGRVLSVIGPGLLVAATGVGAGDLATAGFAGTKLGVAILWAVLLGAGMKFVLTEGIARWQLASGRTLIAGTGHHIGRWAVFLFLLYLIPWTWIVSAALMSGAGAASQAMVPLPLDPTTARLVWGGTLSIACLLLVYRGSFQLFERCMAVGIVIMVLAVVATAVMTEVDSMAVVQGIALPDIPDVQGGTVWTLALMGGVGGTVTMLCYGYWMVQQGRSQASRLRLCRIDIAVGYVMTAVFGVAMVIIASSLPEQDGSGVRLIVSIAASLGDTLGAWARWVFLIGAWTAIISSLLGVWQSVPMIFADTMRTCIGAPPLSPTALERTRTARVVLLLMATLPLVQIVMPFERVQLLYATTGVFFLPLLATTLLVLLRSRWCGPLASGWLARITTALVLGFFLMLAIR